MSKTEATLIEEEIKSIDEMLELHSFHRMALQALLNKMTGAKTEVESTPVVTTEKTGRRNRKHGINREQMTLIAKEVAKLIRQKGLTKLKAIDVLIHCGDIPSESRDRVMSSLNASHLGADVYREIFKGTKYA